MVIRGTNKMNKIKEILQKIIDFLRKLLVREEETTNLGLDLIGIQSPHFKYSKLLPLIQDIPELHLSILWHSFGDDPVRLFDLAEHHNLQSIKISLIWAGCLRGSNASCHPYQIYSGARSVADLESRVRRQDSSLKTAIEARANRVATFVNELKQKYPHIDVIITPELETDVAIDVSEIILQWIRGAFNGQVRFAYNPNKFINRLPAGYDLIETHHDHNIPTAAPYICSLDGWSIDSREYGFPRTYREDRLWTTEQVESWISLHKEKAEKIYLWDNAVSNGIIEGQNLDPRSRQFENTNMMSVMVDFIKRVG